MVFFLKKLQTKKIIVSKLKYSLKKYNQAQIAGLAEVARDIAQILFAGLVVEGLNQKIINLLMIFIGLMGSIILWYTSHLIKSLRSFLRSFTPQRSS